MDAKNIGLLLHKLDTIIQTPSLANMAAEGFFFTETVLFIKYDKLLKPDRHRTNALPHP